MNAIIAIEELIQTTEKRIKALKTQISDHESGENKLSAMKLASAEKALEESQKALEKNRLIHQELLKHDLQELEKEERIKEAIKRKNYFKYQKLRLKRSTKRTTNEKLEAMMIIDELPSDINLEDDDIFDIASSIIKLDLRVHDELESKLAEIKSDFEELLKNTKQEDIIRLGMLHAHIPIVVLHLNVLIENIKEDIERKKLPPFKGLPRFEDWWIDELWKNHQAYFGLYKWKEIVSFLCITDEQKKAWRSIFSNWVFIKKALNRKGPLAYEFNFAFDMLMQKHTKLEEELDSDNLKKMETIIQNITTKEKLNTYKHDHYIETEYLDFKKGKLVASYIEE